MIEREAQERVDRYAARRARGSQSPRRAAEVPEGGWFAPPPLAADLPADSPCSPRRSSARCSRVERVRDVDDACDRVDASPFALTGGLFARNPDTVDRVIERSPVGNLYVNRAITGAISPASRSAATACRHRHEGRRSRLPLQFVEPHVVRRTPWGTVGRQGSAPVNAA